MVRRFAKGRSTRWFSAPSSEKKFNQNPRWGAVLADGYSNGVNTKTLEMYENKWISLGFLFNPYKWCYNRACLGILLHVPGLFAYASV